LTGSKKHRAIVSVINDLVTDQRVHKTCMVLMEQGYDVLLVGRRKHDSMELASRPYRTKRMKLLFEKGVPFYAEYQFRLWLLLLFRRKDLLVSNDLDTLLPSWMASGFNPDKIIYDSHEIFCEVPELIHTPAKKRLWERIEKRIVPKLKYCITVNKSIARWFEERYHVKFHVVRNIGNPPAGSTIKTRAELGLPENKKIVLIQGAGINIDRGAEETVEAMQHLENTLLLIIGGGDVIRLLKDKVASMQLGEKVRFMNKMPSEELFHYTCNSDLGITVDKNNNINYRFSLPNKVFDFINAGVPILASALPEIKHVIDTYRIGDFISSHEPKHIADKIKEMLHSPHYAEWKENTKKAKAENNWQLEKKMLEGIIEEVKMNIE
jgi:glycosyltransferase involved in cell wall biosynthesis